MNDRRAGRKGIQGMGDIQSSALTSRIGTKKINADFKTQIAAPSKTEEGDITFKKSKRPRV